MKFHLVERTFGAIVDPRHDEVSVVMETLAFGCVVSDDTHETLTCIHTQKSAQFSAAHAGVHANTVQRAWRVPRKLQRMIQIPPVGRPLPKPFIEIERQTQGHMHKRCHPDSRRAPERHLNERILVRAKCGIRAIVLIAGLIVVHMRPRSDDEYWYNEWGVGWNLNGLDLHVHHILDLFRYHFHFAI